MNTNTKGTLSEDAKLWLALDDFLTHISVSLPPTDAEAVPQFQHTQEDTPPSQLFVRWRQTSYSVSKASIERAILSVVESGQLAPLIDSESRCLAWMVNETRKFALLHLTDGFPMYETIFPFPCAGSPNRAQDAAKWLLTVWWPNGGLQQAAQSEAALWAAHHQVE